jgi:hypothetical protein
MKIFLAGLFAIITALLFSCKNDVAGLSEPVGGQLPTNFIFIRDTGFVPNFIQATRGSTFTFVNQSSATRAVYSYDSVIIKRPSIDVNTSFLFFKDTIGSINYFMGGRPNFTGVIKIVP